MSSLHPAVAETRRAVRPHLQARAGQTVLVALSGGADSLALTAAVAFEARAADVTAVAVIVDHGLQPGSGEVAAAAQAQARELGLEAEIVRVSIEAQQPEGPEAAARSERYRALDAVAAERGASGIFLGHTLDDQAETVLLGLARGAGATSLQGMAAERQGRVRPLLGVRRESTRAACAAQGLAAWDDPHNIDPAYARVRVRSRVLPVLEAELGPGVAEALARTAEQLREDADAFAEMIEEIIEDIVEHAEAGIAVSVPALTANPAALRNRIIRHVVVSEFGVSLTRSQTLEVARLATAWTGQGPIDLPRCTAARRGNLVVFSARA